MFPKIYDKLLYGQFRICRSQITSSVDGLGVKSVVNVCLMRFSCVFGRFFAWSFSMLLEAVFLRLGHQGYGVYNLLCVDGVENLV